MPDITNTVRALHALDSLALGRTAIHRLHPFAKLCSALVLIVTVVSFGRYDLFRLAPYLFYPFVMTALAEVPHRALAKRILLALPFCLLAGLSNVFFERETAFVLGRLSVSYGALSLMTLLLKMYLTVMAALLLTATTPFVELTAQLRRMHVPFVFVLVFEMTFRYTGVLLAQAHSMSVAYALRSGGGKSLQMKHMGAFVGALLLRGFERAERVHMAMRCRGYSLRRVPPARHPLRGVDIAVLAGISTLSVALRIWNLY